MEGHPEDIDRDVADSDKSSSLSPEFQDILKSDTFVDKSLLILAVFADNVLCTAPRRTGKSVNLTMLQRFLEFEVDKNGKEKTTVLEEKDNYKLFNSTTEFKINIMGKENFVKLHFGQYPVVKLNFYCFCAVKRKSDAVEVCKHTIHKAFKMHAYLYNSKESPLENSEKDICQLWSEFYGEITNEKHVLNGLALLVQCLNKFHNKKVYVLVDEYDSIVSNALYNVKNVDLQREREELEDAAKFCIQIIGSALKQESEIIQGAFMTGILDVAGIDISSALGNVMRRQFGTKNLCQDFYGFNENEVLALFNKWGVDEKLKKKAMAKYNGYFNGSNNPIYNPQSIVQFLKNLKMGEDALQNYWQQSGYIQYLYELLKHDDVRSLLSKLLQGPQKLTNIRITSLELKDLKSLHDLLVHSNLSCKKEIVVKFLISLGYLTYSANDNMLKIPNGELIDEFNKRLYVFFSTKYGIDDENAEDCSQSFSGLVRLCDERDSDTEFKEELTKFQQTLTCLLQTATNIIDPLNEATLQVIVSSVLSQGGFVFGTEIIIPKHGTKTDVVLYNDTFGCVVEIKCMAQSLKHALEQIFTKNYYKVFTVEKYFNEKSPSLHLVIGLHVNSKKRASVLCLRKMDIIDVLDDLKVEATESLENRIQVAVESTGKIAINMFLEKAIGTS